MIIMYYSQPIKRTNKGDSSKKQRKKQSNLHSSSFRAIEIYPQKFYEEKWSIIQVQKR